jgi:Holliday junction resolvase RusA-like endonuclease
MTFTPEKTASMQNLIRLIFAGEYPGHIPFAGPVDFRVIAYFPIPKSGKKIQPGTPCLHAPDWDNLGKLVSDALNGLAYRDDRQVFHADVTKYYDTTPRVEIYARELDDLTLSRPGFLGPGKIV